MDSAIRIVVSLLNKVTTELGTNVSWFFLCWFLALLRYRGCPRNCYALLYGCQQSSIQKTAWQYVSPLAGVEPSAESVPVESVCIAPARKRFVSIRAAHQQYHQEQADHRFYHGVISPIYYRCFAVPATIAFACAAVSILLKRLILNA
jgi:hypothetical protein